MSVTSTIYAVPPALLKRLRSDNDLFGAFFGADEGADEAVDFENRRDEAFAYDGHDIQVATPAKVKKIAGELARVTLASVREKGLANELRTDRRGDLLAAEDYEEQFAEIERVRDFFVAAAQPGNAVVAAAV